MEDFLVRNGLVPYFVGFIFAVISIGMFLSSISHARLVQKLKREGEAVPAIVTDLTKTYVKNPDMMDNKHVLIVYMVQNRRYSFEKYIYPRSDKIYGNLEKGSMVTVLYTSNNPAEAVLSEESVQTSNWSYLILFLTAAFVFSKIFKVLRYSATITSQ